MTPTLIELEHDPLTSCNADGEDIIIGIPRTYEYISDAVNSMDLVEALCIYKRPASSSLFKVLPFLSISKNDIADLADEVSEHRLHRVLMNTVRIGRYTNLRVQSEGGELVMYDSYAIEGISNNPINLVIETPLLPNAISSVSISNNVLTLSSPKDVVMHKHHEGHPEHMKDKSTPYYKGVIGLLSEIITVLHSDPIMFIHLFGMDLRSARLWQLDLDLLELVTETYHKWYK